MGPDDRFREVYEAEFDAVYRTVYLVCRDRDLAEEAVQEAFVRAWERWRRLGAAPWVGGWLTSTALNVARRALRRRPLPPPSRADGGDVEAALDLWRSVAALPLRQQQAVVLHYRLGLTTPQAAAAMGCRESTLRAHLTRARTALRAKLEERDEARPG